MKNILAVRNDRFGEFLLIIPALRALKERFPGSRITIAASPDVLELAEAVGYVDGTIAWENKKRPSGEILALVKKLKEKKFDLAVIFNPSKESNLVTFLAKIPVRVGYDRKWPWLLTDKMKDEKESSGKHEVDHNLELVGLVGASTKDRSLALNIKSADVLGALKGSPIVVIHPWTSDPVKQWPLKNFKKLIERFSGMNVLVIGGREELLKNKNFLNDLPAEAVNLVGRTSLVGLAGILKRADILVSGDSGPVHLAAAVGTPVVALFRNDMPGKTAVRWGPWGNGHVVIEKAKLEYIAVDEVVKKVREKLAIC